MGKVVVDIYSSSFNGVRIKVLWFEFLFKPYKNVELYFITQAVEIWSLLNYKSSLCVSSSDEETKETEEQREEATGWQRKWLPPLTDVPNPTKVAEVHLLGLVAQKRVPHK